MNSGLHLRLLWVASIALVVLAGHPGCNRTGAPKAAAATQGAAPPPFPSDFTPPPPLADPPAPAPGKSGLLYLQRIYGVLGEPWSTFLEDCRLRLHPDHALNRSTLAARVDLAIDKQGALHAARLVSPSGNDDFDQAALEIVRDAAPFPEPPYHLVSDDDLVHVSWLFARDRRQAGVATAEIRVEEWPARRAVPKFLTAGDVTTAAERLAAAVEGARPGQEMVLIGLGRDLAVAALREALGSGDPAAQRVAARAAGEAKVLAAAPELRGIIDRSVDAAVRGEAIAAVGAIGDQGAGQLLVGVLETAKGSGIGGQADSSVAAARALAAIGRREVAESTVLRWLGAEDAESRWAALVVMSEFGVAAAAPELMAMLADRSLSREERMAACAALGAGLTRAGANAGLKALYRHVGQSDAGVRAACVRAVARAARSGVRSRMAYWKMVELIKKDRDERVRAAAVRAAAALEPGRFHQEMYLLHREESPVVLAALAEALGSMSQASALGRLAALVEHEDIEVRRRAVASLARHRSPRAAKILAGLVDDGDLDVRLTAIGALEDGPAVRALLEEPLPAVRAAAFARVVEAQGPWATLGQLARGIAEAKPGSAARARWAMAWLVP